MNHVCAPQIVKLCGVNHGFMKTVDCGELEPLKIQSGGSYWKVSESEIFLDQIN